MNVVKKFLMRKFHTGNELKPNYNVQTDCNATYDLSSSHVSRHHLNKVNKINLISLHHIVFLNAKNNEIAYYKISRICQN